MEAPGQSGENPALQSEAKRAQVEYKTLKKFSPQFANEFMQSFRLLGSNSVDAAYQAAAEKAGMDPRKAKEISNADAGSKEHKIAVQSFVTRNTMQSSVEGITMQSTVEGISMQSSVEGIAMQSFIKNHNAILCTKIPNALH